MLSKRAFLSQVSILQHLSDVQLNELDHITTILNCSPGRILYRPGEHASSLFIVRSGHIQHYHLSTDGRKFITNTLITGTYFGEEALLAQRPYTHFAETMVESIVYVIPRAYLEQLLQTIPTFAAMLLSRMAQRSLQLETQLIDTAFKSTTARLAGLLLQLARPQKSKGKKTLAVSGLSHEDLADRLGVYRETVSSALRDLKEMKIIELGRKHITICDTSRLQETATPTQHLGR